MKSFTSAVIITVSAAFASAQITTDPNTGAITCAIPNGAYCAGDSLSTNIIIRCIDGVGHPGNCNDNLSGLFPVGVNFAPCYQTSLTSGDAACSKNCIVEGNSGNFPGTLSLPGCTQQVQSTSSSATPTSSVSGNTTTTPPSHTSTPSSGPSNSRNQTTLSTKPIGTGTIRPPPNSSNGTITTPVMPPVTPVGPGGSTSTGGGNGGSGGSGGNSNGNGGGNGNGGEATATPSGPSSTHTVPPSQFTGGAITNSAGSALAVVALAAAYLL